MPLTTCVVARRLRATALPATPGAVGEVCVSEGRRPAHGWLPPPSAGDAARLKGWTALRLTLDVAERHPAHPAGLWGPEHIIVGVDVEMYNVPDRLTAWLYRHATGLVTVESWFPARPVEGWPEAMGRLTLHRMRVGVATDEVDVVGRVDRKDRPGDEVFCPFYTIDFG